MTAPASAGSAPTVRAAVGGGVAGFAGPSGTRLVSKPGVVVSRFQSGHGWVKTTSEGTTTEDTSEFLWGSQSLRLVTGGAGAAYNSMRRSSLSLNLTQNDLKVWVRIQNVAAVSQLLLYASSTNFAGDVWSALELRPVGTYTHLRNGQWGVLTFGPSNFNIVGGGGAPNWAAINSLQFSLRDNATAPATVHLGSVELVPRAANPFVSFCFDDGWDGVYTRARPILDAYGYTGTAFIISDLIGTPGFMTMDQLKRLETAGWEIAAHSDTAADHNLANGLLDLSTYRLRRNLFGQRQWLWANGFGGTGIAYPRGANTVAMRDEVRKVWSYGRSVHALAGSETVPPADPMQLRAHEIYFNTTTTAIDALVTAAVAGNRWCILEFHQVRDVAPDTFDYSTANFQTVVNDVAAKSGVVVLPMRDVLTGGWV